MTWSHTVSGLLPVTVDGQEVEFLEGPRDLTLRVLVLAAKRAPEGRGPAEK